MFTEGDTRYIKRHTEKTFKELNIKGVKMKSTKKRPAKRTDNPLIGKLLRLKYRINNTASEEGGWSTDMQDHKSWVMKLISEVRLHNLTKLAKEDILLCNSLWRRYE
tara:strand:+ start:1090 stop:1410 length:321 start_codon:yes stop_codon:yes gene_type:complete